MTTLERLQARRDEYVKQRDGLQRNLDALTGAIQAMEREIADEQGRPEVAS